MNSANPHPTAARGVARRIFLLAGILLLAGAAAGFVSLALASKHYLKAEGTVTYSADRREYRYRRSYKHNYDVRIAFPTPDYGTRHISMSPPIPLFLDKGDHVGLLYHPELLEDDVRYPGLETRLYIVLLIAGAGLAYLGRKSHNHTSKKEKTYY